MCSYYVIVAWIWSLIWYLGLDPIKWAMMYALNEDGIRNKNAHKEAKRVRSEGQLTSTGLASPILCCTAIMQASSVPCKRQILPMRCCQGHTGVRECATAVPLLIRFPEARRSCMNLWYMTTEGCPSRISKGAELPGVSRLR